MLIVLLGFRLIFAIGAAGAATMLSAVLGDYVYIEDRYDVITFLFRMYLIPYNRGKASGLLGLSAGGGAVLGALFLLQIPNWLATHGYSAKVAGMLKNVTLCAVF